MATQRPLHHYPVPKYFRVKEALLEDITSGDLEPGMMLPSENELCEAFGVSRITVRRAVSDLVHEGMLRTVQGKGTFVTEPKVPERFVQFEFGVYEEFRRRGIVLSTDVIRQELRPASAKVARRLDIDVGTDVLELERLRSVDDEKLVLSTTYITAHLCPLLVDEDLSAGSLYELLRTKYGLVSARGVHSLESIPATGKEADFLEVSRGTPLLLLDTVMYLADGRPLEHSRVVQRGDRVRVMFEFSQDRGDASLQPQLVRSTAE